MITPRIKLAKKYELQIEDRKSKKIELIQDPFIDCLNNLEIFLDKALQAQTIKECEFNFSKAQVFKGLARIYIEVMMPKERFYEDNQARKELTDKDYYDRIFQHSSELYYSGKLLEN